MAREITNIELVDTVDKASGRRPGQQREFNYVFQIDAIDSETGEQLMAGEFRTIATDQELTPSDAEAKMRELIEIENRS